VVTTYCLHSHLQHPNFKIPFLRNEQSHDPKINDKLRILSSQELQMILTPNTDKNPDQTLHPKSLVAATQFSRFEAETIQRFIEGAEKNTKTNMMIIFV
jgi:hypothetical protein